MSGGGTGGGMGGTVGGPEDDENNTNRSPLGNVQYDETDLAYLSSFQTDLVPQHLIDKGLITPFELKYDSISKALPGQKTVNFMSPSEWSKEHQTTFNVSMIRDAYTMDYWQSGGVKNWISEMEAQRANQYANWKTDFGHFLGSSGTRLASRFDQEEAKLSKKTLLAGGQG